MDSITWKLADFEAGLCAHDQIETVRTEPEPPSPLDLEQAPRSLRKRLQNDALQAYHDLGGVEYLKKNPELLDKILAKTIAPEALPAVHTNVFQFPEMPWLTSRRLAYQESADVAEDISSRTTALPPADKP